MTKGDIHTEKRAILENFSLDIEESGGHEPPVVAVGIIDAQGSFKAIGALTPLPTSVTSGSERPTSARKTVTAAGTAEALGGDVDCKNLVVVADPDNAGNIYLGDSNVDNTKGKLPPGAIMPCGAANLSEVFIDVDNSGEGVSYFYTV